ncbi:peptidoglycan-binding protein [Allonocardiopsis opalescens]|uniref:Putative peptidoglycan binding protein n=1 Tax=Allonocardiopsis opalescens TaxID=1144618 RepID=A0A2T0Q456_9ACTN|nr:peptidoglycan-binding protein [Allonocardiopsis opalescens]PRX98588.1 putative peptidoglycan binding protein [Allonocardiopsis opalescens]
MAAHTAVPAMAAEAARTEREAAPPGRVRRTLDLLGALARALFTAEGAETALPAADPAEVRALLIELGRLDAAEHPAGLPAALAAFQRDAGLPADGVAGGRTVTALTRAARERRELAALGLLAPRG